MLGDSIGAGIVDHLSKDDLQAMEDEESKTDVLDEPKQNGGNYQLENLAESGYFRCIVTEIFSKKSEYHVTN